MLIHQLIRRCRAGMTAGLLVPAVLSTHLAFAGSEEASVVPPAPEPSTADSEDASTADSGAPAPEQSEPAAASSATDSKSKQPKKKSPMPEPGKCRVSDCGPGRSGCASGRAGCAPHDPVTIVCRPSASRGTLGRCGSAACGPCASGTYHSAGSCLPGRSCQSGSGIPCLTNGSNAFTAEEHMGRPYTIGDLKRDLFGLKCRAARALGTPCHPLEPWCSEQKYRSHCRRAYRNRVLAAHLHNKFNYFKPSGCCGEGCPLAGKYHRVYAVTPHYSHPRDSQVYASPRTGVPMVVPIAPNVRHQYNYSWGVPSSRVTRISNVVQPRR